jgi:low affinity Fe/Cu permease
MGHPVAFVAAGSLVLVWLVTGPIFRFSDTWQLVINTGTTIITFLMVFLIQSAQNRDNYALQLKLDELIRATHGAHLALLDIERLSESELETLTRRFEHLAQLGREQLKQGQSDAGTPELDASVSDDAPSRASLA